MRSLNNLYFALGKGFLGKLPFLLRPFSKCFISLSLVVYSANTSQGLLIASIIAMSLLWHGEYSFNFF